MSKNNVNTVYQDAWREFTWSMDVNIITPWMQGNPIDPSTIEKMFGKWGEWEEIKSKVDDQLDDENYYADKCHMIEADLKEDVYQLQREIAKYKEDVEGVVNKLWQITPVEKDKEEYEELLDKLNEIVE